LTNNSPNVAYCTLTVQLGGSDGNTPVIAVSGFILAPDSSVVAFGPGGEFKSFADLEIPFKYGDSILSIRNKIIPALQTGYSAPDLQAAIILVPLF
jgi:hypothetical protein